MELNWCSIIKYFVLSLIFPLFLFYGSLQAWSYTNQEEELNARAPTFLASLKAAGVNEEALARSKVKSYQTIRPGIMTAAGGLLQCRNSQMTAHATMTGLQLEAGKCTKKTHERLKARSVALASATTKRKQTSLGLDFDKEVKDWKTQIEKEESELRELKIKCQPIRTKIEEGNYTFQDRVNLRKLEETIAEAQACHHPGFKLVGDNIDWNINPRHWTRTAGRRGLHYFNLMAVKNRVRRPLYKCNHVI